MRVQSKGTMLAAAAALLLASSCLAPVPRPEGGSGPEYSVHVLTAPSLLATSVGINGRSVDASSIESIDSSVRAIVGSRSDLAIVRASGTGKADLAVDFSAESPALPSTFYGVDIQWNSKYFLAMPKYRELIRHIKVDIARFPGGQERFRYDRGARTSPKDELGKDEPYQYALTGEDMSNFIAFCRDLGIEAEPEFNLYNDDPAMWAAMADQVVNGLGYDLKYLSAGNEPEVNVFSNWDYFGAKSKTEALAEYAARYLRYRAAIDAVKPGLLYAFAETGEWDEPGLGQNLDALLGGLGGSRPGAISIHWYPLGEWKGQSKSDPAHPSLGHLVMRGNSRHEISYLSTIAANAKAAAARRGLGDSKLFMGEWSVAWSGGEDSVKLQGSLAAAIFSAEVQEYCKILGFDSLQYFSLSDPAAWGGAWRPALIAVEGDAMSLRPQYYVYLMYKYLYGDRIVPVPGGRSDDWSLYASKGASSDYLMLINRSERKTYRKTAELKTKRGTRLVGLTFPPRSVTIVGFDD